MCIVSSSITALRNGLQTHLVCSSNVRVLSQQLLDLIIEPIIGKNIVDVDVARLRARLPCSHGQRVVHVLVAAVIGITVGPLCEIIGTWL